MTGGWPKKRCRDGGARKLVKHAFSVPRADEVWRVAAAFEAQERRWTTRWRGRGGAVAAADTADPFQMGRKAPFFFFRVKTEPPPDSQVPRDTLLVCNSRTTYLTYSARSLLRGPGKRERPP